ncbi:MAG: hypothetical protein WCI88_13775 [Chloroflexota bacterium]
MKLSWIIALLSISVSIANARIGESIDQIQAKYRTRPVDYDFIQPTAMQTRYFMERYLHYAEGLNGKLDNYSGFGFLEDGTLVVRVYGLQKWAVGVVFVNGKSVMEAFMKNFPAVDKEDIVEQNDVSKFLEANSYPNAEWTEISSGQAAGFREFEKGWITMPKTNNQIEAFQSKYYFVLVSKKFWDFMHESSVSSKTARDNALEKL